MSEIPKSFLFYDMMTYRCHGFLSSLDTSGEEVGVVTSRLCNSFLLSGLSDTVMNCSFVKKKNYFADGIKMIMACIISGQHVSKVRGRGSRGSWMYTLG